MPARVRADDGINFDRRGMRRVRKVLDLAAEGKKFAPLIDIHTGNIGPSSPSAVSYLSHFPYADSAWNGEGFNFALDSAYWLTDVSGFIHGIPCDRLGGPDSIKGMLFGNYERNSASAQPIWQFWDEVKIEQTEMIGWWEDDAPVKVLVLPPVPAPPVPAPGGHNVSCVDSFTHTKGSFINSAGGAAGDIGFGSDCGPPGSNKKYPKLSIAEAKATCCKLGAECVGFSWPVAHVGADGKNSGCFEKNKAGMAHEAGIDGYEKVGGRCTADDIKSTTYVNYGKSAVVVIASWCAGGGSANVTLDVDWAALGLSAAMARVTQPLVKGVQVAKDHGKGGGSFTITNKANGGAMLLIQ